VASKEAVTALGVATPVDATPPHQVRVNLSSIDLTTQERTYDISFLTDLSSGGMPFDSALVLPSSIYQWNTSTSISSGAVQSNLTLYGSASLAQVSVSIASAPLRGEYPIEYVVHEAGTWELHVQDMNGLHIQGSPFSPVVSVSRADGSSSPARGQGLVEGVAGNTLNFTIQARDAREYERQVVSIQPTRVVPRDHAMQFVCSSSATGNVSIILAGIPTILAADATMTEANDLLASHPLLLMLPFASMSIDSDVCTGSTVTLTVSGLGPLDTLELRIDDSMLSSGSIVSFEAAAVQGMSNFRPEVIRIQCSGLATIPSGGMATFAFPRADAIALHDWNATASSLVAGLQQ